MRRLGTGENSPPAIVLLAEGARLRVHVGQRGEGVERWEDH